MKLLLVVLCRPRHDGGGASRRGPLGETADGHVTRQPDGGEELLRARYAAACQQCGGAPTGRCRSSSAASCQSVSEDPLTLPVFSVSCWSSSAAHSVFPPPLECCDRESHEFVAEMALRKIVSLSFFFLKVQILKK